MQAGVCTCHVKVGKYERGLVGNQRDKTDDGKGIEKYNGKGTERTLGYRKLNLIQLTTDGHFRFLNMVKEFHEGSSHLWLGISVEFGADDSGLLN